MQQAREKDCEDVAYHGAADIQNYFKRHVELFDYKTKSDNDGNIKQLSSANILSGIMLNAK